MLGQFHKTDQKFSQYVRNALRKAHTNGNITERDEALTEYRALSHGTGLLAIRPAVKGREFVQSIPRAPSVMYDTVNTFVIV